MGILDSVLKVGGLLLGGWQTASNAHNQREANKTNIKLQREQQAWEQMMSNTAVQRRRDDIEAAGGNPALAFTNGSEASTPVMSPARIEPVRNDISGLATALQLSLMKAQINKTEAEARSANVDAKNKEMFGFDQALAVTRRKHSEAEMARYKSHILEQQLFTSAAERKRAEGTVDAMIKMANQQAEAGQLDLEALRNIAQVGGLEAGKMKDVIKLIIDFFRK